MGSRRTRTTCRRLATPLLAVTAGILTGQAIQKAAHHDRAWPWLAVLAALAWVAEGLAMYLPYLAERRHLLRQRDALLRLREQVPQMVREAMREKGGE
jgi:hypothetical protein